MRRLVICALLVAALLSIPAYAVRASELLEIGMPSIEPIHSFIFEAQPYSPVLPSASPVAKNKSVVSSTSARGSKSEDVAPAGLSVGDPIITSSNEPMPVSVSRGAPLQAVSVLPEEGESVVLMPGTVEAQ